MGAKMEYSATVAEMEDGTWFIRMGNAADSQTFDFCWGGEADFLTNREDRQISAMRIRMNR